MYPICFALCFSVHLHILSFSHPSTCEDIISITLIWFDMFYTSISFAPMWPTLYRKNLHVLSSWGYKGLMLMRFFIHFNGDFQSVNRIQRFSQKSVTEKKTSTQLKMSKSIVILVIAFCCISQFAAQTFQYSRGWTNGKRSPGATAANSVTDLPPSFRQMMPNSLLMTASELNNRER